MADRSSIVLVAPWCQKFVRKPFYLNTVYNN